MPATAAISAATACPVQLRHHRRADQPARDLGRLARRARHLDPAGRAGGRSCAELSPAEQRAAMRARHGRGLGARELGGEPRLRLRQPIQADPCGPPPAERPVITEEIVRRLIPVVRLQVARGGLAPREAARRGSGLRSSPSDAWTGGHAEHGGGIAGEPRHSPLHHAPGGLPPHLARGGFPQFGTTVTARRFCGPGALVRAVDLGRSLP